MARPPSDNPKLHPVCVRLTPEQREKLDRMRGETPASEFIRDKVFGDSDA